MPGNTIGKMFTVTTFGESHGPAIGCVVDGCPSNLTITNEDIQLELERRRPGTSNIVSQRKEPDQVEIISGIFEDKTTGTPICLLINNVNAKEKDYQALKYKFRPGHGDYTYQKKYGIRDYLGGGRASARETAARVAAGAIAKKYLSDKYKIHISARVTQVGDVKGTQEEIEDLITQIRKEGDSIGSKIHLNISNVPVGLGEPVFDKLHADLAHAIFSINAVKGLEFGGGFSCITKKGSVFRDLITPDGFESNNAGGTLGGISTGQDITANIAFKAAASIRIPGKTITTDDQPCEVVTTGRHDPCPGLRAPVIVESMAAIIICDHILRHRGQNG